MRSANATIGMCTKRLNMKIEQMSIINKMPKLSKYVQQYQKYQQKSTYI